MIIHIWKYTTKHSTAHYLASNYWKNKHAVKI